MANEKVIFLQKCEKNAKKGAPKVSHQWKNRPYVDFFAFITQKIENFLTFLPKIKHPPKIHIKTKEKSCFLVLKSQLIYIQFERSHSWEDMP